MLTVLYEDKELMIIFNFAWLIQYMNSGYHYYYRNIMASILPFPPTNFVYKEATL